MRGLVSKSTTRGLRRALNMVGTELRLAQRHWAGVRRARTLADATDLRLHLGSGGQPKEGWVNVDLFAESADVHLDVREDLPFSDNSAAFVYSEHLFEHLDYPVDAQHLLAEIRRVLKPGGILSMVVPHFGKALQAYASGDECFFTGPDRVRSYLQREHPTLMHHVNYWFRQDGHHRYAYDAETFIQVLTNAGFTAVRERAFDPMLDSEKRFLLHSLYIEAIKPAD
jgi:predicted SAM-dependent methyltransferase